MRPDSAEIEVKDDICQVDKLLRRKLTGAGIEQYVTVSAWLVEGEGKRLLKEYQGG